MFKYVLPFLSESRASLLLLLISPTTPPATGRRSHHWLLSELYAAIRRDHRGGLSMRELERKHGVTWRTVRKALDSSWPEPRKRLPPRATGVDRYKPVIDEILRADLDAPRK